MNRKMLKKDLIRKKSMNIILLIFVLLASMFVSTSINNTFVVFKGTEGFLDISGVKDFFIVVMNESVGGKSENDERIEKFLNNSDRLQ